MARKKLQPKPKQDKKSWQKRDAARKLLQQGYAKAQADAHASSEEQCSE